MPQKTRPKTTCSLTRRSLLAATVGVQAIILGLAWYLTYGGIRAGLEGVIDLTATRDSVVAPGSTLQAKFVGDALRSMAVQAGVGGALVLLVTTIAFSLIARWYDRAVAARSRELEAEVGERIRQQLATRHALIFGLAKLADYRDTDTGAHLDRISEYSALLARAVAADNPEIDADWIERLRLASSLHDIGKVGVADEVLLKPGRLTDAERALMQKHTLIGADTLIAIRGRLGDDPLLDMGISVALQHHERWDGGGYPYGLKEREITLAARIVALADFYDALTSRRVYKEASTHEETVDLIRKGRGTHFDPAIADAFLARHERFAEIRRTLQDDAARRTPRQSVSLRAA